MHVDDDILDDFFRGVKTKGGRVTDVQFQNTMAFVFQTTGFFVHRTADVVTDIVQLVRFFNK